MPARPRLLSLLAASLLSCLAVAKSFLCRAPCAASLLLPLGGKALRQMKSKYRGPALLPAQGVPRHRPRPEGPDPEPQGIDGRRGRQLPAALLPTEPSLPRCQASIAMRAPRAWAWGCRSHRAGLGRPHAPRGPHGPAASPAHRGAFVCAQPAGVTPPRERTGRSPTADCSRQAWPPLGARFISAGSRGWGVSAGTGWQRALPAGPSAPAAVWPQCGTAKRGELRAPAAGRGLCLGTAPWAIRDLHMAGMDGGCSRGGWHKQWPRHLRGHCRAPVPVPCSPWGSGLAEGLSQTVGALLPGGCGGV